MLSSKFIVALFLLVLFIFVTQSFSEESAPGTTYRCQIKRNINLLNPITIFRYFGCLLKLNNKLLFFNERTEDEFGNRELDFSSKNKQLAYVSKRGRQYYGFANIDGSPEMSGNFNQEQMDVMFLIYDLVIKEARLGYKSPEITFKTSKSLFRIEIMALEEEPIKVGENFFQAIVLEARIRKYGKHFADVFIWISSAKDEKNRSKVLRCLFSIVDWPKIILNMEENQ